MNTLLPYADFPKSAECLDDKRLSKQRADVINILKALSEPPPADGVEHPVIKMWRGNEHTLVKYGMAVCIEWAGRGNTDNTLRKIMAYKSDFEPSDDPEWLGDENVHVAHQSFLLRSQPSFYRRFWPDLPDDMAMVWPRSPEKQRASQEDKMKEKLVKRAHKMKERAEAAVEDAHDAAIKAGLDPETLEPMADIEADPEMAAL